MREFIIPDKQFVEGYTARYLEDNYLCDVVSENNSRWSMWHDDDRMAIVARCENKPRDLLVYGLKWEATQ